MSETPTESHTDSPVESPDQFPQDSVELAQECIKAETLAVTKNKELMRRAANFLGRVLNSDSKIVGEDEFFEYHGDSGPLVVVETPLYVDPQNIADDANIDGMNSSRLVDRDTQKTLSQKVAAALLNDAGVEIMQTHESAFFYKFKLVITPDLLSE